MRVGRFRVFLFSAVVFLCPLLVTGHAAAQATKALGLEDALRFRTFDDLTPISLSPDGNWAAFTVRENLRSRTVDDRTWRLTGIRDIFTGTDIYLLNLHSGSLITLPEGQFDSFEGVWSPDSRHLAFISDQDGSHQAKLWIWDAQSGTERKLSDLGVRQLGPVAWTADSQSIIVPVLPKGISGERYAQELSYASSETNGSAAAATAGSTVVVFRSENAHKNEPSEASNPWTLKIFLRDLVVIDVGGGEVRPLVQGKVAGYAISPDGHKIAYSVPKRFENAGSQQTLFDLFTANLDGTNRQLLVSDARLDYDGASFSWSPDSLSLAYYAFRLHRLYTLSVIYGYDYDRLAGMCGIPASETVKEHQKLHLPRTYLVGPMPERFRETLYSATKLRDKLRTERTNLVPKIIETWQEVPLVLQLMDGSDPLYGYIGVDDYTLYPIVRPGAFVRIDPRQRKIPSQWRTDNRPIFFIELRDRYVCTWCEMHDGRLILVPSQQSKRHTQPVRYPTDATIIGRVTGISMDIVEAEENEARA